MTSFPENFNDTVVKAIDEGFPLLMPRWGYVVSAFVLFLIGFFGFFLNLLVILLMFKDRQLWTPLNIILFNLVCSDFSVSVLGNPFTLVSALFHRWIFGRTMCVLYGFFMALLGITSITTLTVISFERYLMVTRPLSSRHLSSKGAALSIVFIWSYSLALTTPPLMGWGNYVNEAANISCSVNWHEQSTNTLSYILFLFAMGQLVPLSVITFSYVNIIRTMKRNSKRLGRVSRAESRATTMVFIMILSFTVAWTPYSIFALMEQFATEGIISPGTGVIPALVAKSSICYDPLIYVGMNTQFRQAIKRVFGIHSKGKNSRLERGFNNTLVLSAHRFSTFNEVTVRCNSSETNFSGTPRRGKSIGGVDEQSDVVTTDNHRTQKVSDLSTIQENKTVSDAERSGETVYDEDSSSNKKLELFGELRKTDLKNSPNHSGNEREQLVDKGNSSRSNSVAAEDILINVYENQIIDEMIDDQTNDDLIEKDSSDCTTINQDNILKESHDVKIPMIRQSYSLDLGSEVNKNKPRKFSIEPKVENVIPSRSFFKGRVMSKFFDSDSKKKRDNFKSYLFKKDILDSQDEL